MSWRLRKFWLDLRMGRCSGFPDCCIIFFSTAWRLLYGDERISPDCKEAWRMRMVEWYHDRAGSPGYVPCPLCIISGARVRVNRCTDECGHRKEIQGLVLERNPNAKFR